MPRYSRKDPNVIVLILIVIAIILSIIFSLLYQKPDEPGLSALEGFDKMDTIFEKKFGGTPDDYRLIYVQALSMQNQTLIMENGNSPYFILVYVNTSFGEMPTYYHLYIVDETLGYSRDVLSHWYYLISKYNITLTENGEDHTISGWLIDSDEAIETARSEYEDTLNIHRVALYGSENNPVWHIDGSYEDDVVQVMVDATTGDILNQP